MGAWFKKNHIVYSSEIYNILEIDEKDFDHKYENFLNLIHPEDKEDVNFFYFNSFKNLEKESTFKYRIITKSGKIKYLEQKLETKFDENKNPTTSFGTIQDISEKEFYRQKLEEDYTQIKKQQDELKAIFDNTRDGLAIVDLKTNFLKVNKTYCEITGLSEEELLATSCIEITSPELLEEAKKKLRRIFNNKWIKTIWKNL